MDRTDVFEKILDIVETNTKKTENYLSAQEKVSSLFRDSIKSLYDFTKGESNRKTEALPELITEGFDSEQIWQQLELQNEGEFPHLLTGISKSLSSKKLNLPIKLTKNEKEEEAEMVEESESNENDELSSEDNDDVDGLGDNIWKKKKKKVKKDVRKKTRPSIVDDQFFKLQELDEYLTKEDKKAFRSQDSKKSEEKDSEDESSVDLFDYVSENGSDDEDADDDPRLVKFKDFFDDPEENNDDKNADGMEDGENSIDENREGDGEDEDYLHSNDENTMKRVKFNLENESDGDNTDDEKPEVKSSLEARQERLKRRIEELEEAAISEKPWQLKGEVSAANRPQNSLLEEHVEFDITSRPAPVITEQTTMKLEDIIRQRIKDKAWDDVEKKFKPVETPMEYKKKLILDQEKSKVSLAQIYENEYLKQKEALDPNNEDKEIEEPKEHIEIREMMHSLFNKLDALSNFHYTPRLARPDVKIVSNLPAITMEEVAPVATSDATLLAPEEIKAKPRGELIGKGERTETDMNRARRQKKLKQREREKSKEKKEKLLEKLKPGLGNKYSKEKASKLIENLVKERNISKIDENSGIGGKASKSSTAFFEQLQDQAKSHIKLKTGNMSKNNKDKKSASAIKLKL